MSRLTTPALSVACALLLIGFVSQCSQRRTAEAAHHEATVKRDSLAAEHAASRARAEGWEVIFADIDPRGMMLALKDKNAELARLSEDYRAANVRIESLIELTASAEGEGETTPTLVPAEGGGQAIQVRIREDVLALDALITPDPLIVRYSYLVQVPCEIVSSRTGDGRLLISARSLHELGRCAIEEAVFDPPPPVIERRTDWWGGLKWAMSGATVITLVREVFSAIGR